MKWLVDQIYGANGAGDPYYEFFVDAAALIPWWYPSLIFGIAAMLLLYRWCDRAMYRRQSVMAAFRVRERTQRRFR